MKRMFTLFIALCVLITCVSINIPAYAGPVYETALSPKAVTGIGGYSTDQGKSLDYFRIGGTAYGVVNAYSDASVQGGNNSKDVKAGFARFDLGDDVSAVTKYELKLSGGWIEANRNGKINLYAAVADVNSTVVLGKTPMGDNWTTLIWNNRPQLLTKLDSSSPTVTVTPAEDVSIDVTELLKDKTGSVTIAVLGEISAEGSSSGDMCYGTVQLVRTSTEWTEQEVGISMDFKDESVLDDWIISSGAASRFGNDSVVGNYLVLDGAAAATAPRTAAFETTANMVVEFDMMIPSKKADGVTANTLSGGNLSGIAMMNGTTVAGAIGLRGDRNGVPSGILFNGSSSSDYTNTGGNSNVNYDKWMHYTLILDTANDTGDLYIINPATGEVYDHENRFNNYASRISGLTNIGIISTSGCAIAIANLDVHAANPKFISISSEDDMDTQYIPGEGSVSTIQYSSEAFYELGYNKNGGQRTSTGKNVILQNKNITYFVSDSDGNEPDADKISVSPDGLLSIYPTADAGEYTVTAACDGVLSEALPLTVSDDATAYAVQIYGEEDIILQSGGTCTYKALPLAETGIVLPEKEVKWEITGDSLGCTIDKDGTLTTGNTSGKITIKATIEEDNVSSTLDVYLRNNTEGSIEIGGVLLTDGTAEFTESNSIAGIALKSDAAYDGVTVNIKAFSKNNVLLDQRDFEINDIKAQAFSVDFDEALAIGKAKYLRIKVFDKDGNLISSKCDDLTEGTYKNIPIVADWVWGIKSGMARSIPAGINPELVNTDLAEAKYTYQNYDSEVVDKKVTTNNLLWYKTGAWNNGSNIYERDSADWEQQALPIGNGYMGAMLFGMPAKDHIQFNEETFWALGYHGTQEQQSPSFNNDKMSEVANGYMNAGNIFVDFGLPRGETVTNYYRDLNIDESVAHVEYEYGGVKYNREYFASYPKEVIAVRYTTDTAGALNFTVNPVSAHPGNMTVKDGEITIIGKLKDSEPCWSVSWDGESDLEYCTKIKVVLNGSDGEMIDHYGNVEIKNASDVVIYIAAATDYDPDMFEFNADGSVNMEKTPYKDERGVAAAIEKAEKRINGAAAASYDDLKAEHIADYKSQFDKVHFSLADDICKTPTNELQSSFRNVINSSGTSITYNKAQYDALDKHLEGLHYNYARYLLISSSRSTTLPANLQGKWCQTVAEIWGACYCININLEMNYWFAGGANLLDSGEALIDWFNSQIPAGRVTAKNMYSVTPKSYTFENGKMTFTASSADEDDVFIMHTKQGINGTTDMTGGISIQSAGNTAWLMYNLWDLYQTSGDTELLRDELYPIMRKSANFYTQYLYNNLRKTTTDTEKYPDGYYYTTWAGASPEQGPVQEGIKYDLQLVAGMYDYTIAAAKVLGIDEDKVAAWEEIRNHLELPVELGDDGQIKEWAQETHYNQDASGKTLGESGGHHRHISHLVGLYPGTLINRDTPELLEGAKIVLEKRGDDSTGWSCSNKFLLWARTLNGDKALELFRYQLARKTYSNLFDFHEPFQIDGNFGSAAGVMELLMQSHTGPIYLLPALPTVWDKGYISGIKAKNGAEIDIEWADNKLKSAVITPVADGNIKIGYDIEDTNLKVTASDGTETVLAAADGVYELWFATAGTEYTIVPTNDAPSPVPTPSPTPSPTPNTEITLTENHVCVSGQQSGTLIIAGYDKNGVLIKTEVINGYDSDITGYEACAEIKAFLWDSVDGMEPLCEDKSVIIAG